MSHSPDALPCPPPPGQITQHYSKPRVTPVEVMPVFPDFKVGGHPQAPPGVRGGTPRIPPPTSRHCPTGKLRHSLPPSWWNWGGGSGGVGQAVGSHSPFLPPHPFFTPPLPLFMPPHPLFTPACPLFTPPFHPLPPFHPPTPFLPPASLLAPPDVDQPLRPSDLRLGPGAQGHERPGRAGDDVPGHDPVRGGWGGQRCPGGSVPHPPSAPLTPPCPQGDDG